jgi:tRNA 2-thiouridine synthesizing protein A
MDKEVKEIHTECMRHIDCINQPCPLPLMETRKAVMKGHKGDVVKITGTHENSKFEIPMALESMKCEVREITFRI